MTADRTSAADPMYILLPVALRRQPFSPDPQTGDWACVVLYRFDRGDDELRMIYRGTKRNCERLEDNLARAGIINYFGELEGRIVQYAHVSVDLVENLGENVVDATIRPQEPA